MIRQRPAGRLTAAAFCLLVLHLALPALALGPHECVILANIKSRESIDLANFYAHTRQIPPQNIILLDLPGKSLNADASLTAEEFRTYIYEPVLRTLRTRGIIGHVLVWLYSCDFPAVIDTDPPLSLTGMTFVRGRIPDAKAVTSGQWLSPLFAGPDREGGPYSPSATMEEFTIRLTTNMPLPNMMIGWTGSRGLELNELKDNLAASAAADAGHPSASVYFEVTGDVRSQTRSWQFDAVTRELSSLGVAAFQVTNAPNSRPDIMGIMAGRPVFNKGQYGPLQPGAYADHLTSFAAVFDNHNQRKLTEWIRLGAAGSSGTVTEPGSLTEPVALWAKFPHARLFTHYANGCTLIESLYQSIRSPLQILLVGDALCSPWARPPGITLVNMADDEDRPLIGKAEFLASSWGGFGEQPPVNIFFLDGKPLTQSDKSLLTLDSRSVHDGFHRLRAVAYARGQIRHQGFDRKLIEVKNNGRSVEIGGYTQGQDADVFRHLTFTISAEGAPKEAAIVAQERVVARAPYTDGMTLSVPPYAVGTGPVEFQAVAVYADNEPVRSAPVLLHIGELNRPPENLSVSLTTNAQDQLVLYLSAEDPENDRIQKVWYADLLADGTDMTLEDDALNLLENIPGSGTLAMQAKSGTIVSTRPVDEPGKLRELRTTLRFRGGYDISYKHRSGIVFNYRDSGHYMFWGIDGNRSAWVLERVENGKSGTILSRGRALASSRDYDIQITAVDNSRLGFFVNNELLAVADASFAAGRIGLLNGEAAADYRHLLASPVSAIHPGITEQMDDLVLDGTNSDMLDALYGAARDVQYTPVVKVR